MNRKQWILPGILITALLVAGIVFLVVNLTDEPAEAGQDFPATALTYCNDEQTRPCVVSFGVDADDRLLVNLLLPDLSYPAFHLTIRRGEQESRYQCQRVSTDLNTAYCVGEKMPPGETLHLMLFSKRNDILLAEGDLSIIGLALPTLAVVSPTLGPTSTEATMPPTLSPTALTIPTPRVTPTPTSASYPNPTSYPNLTSYP